LKSWIAWAHGLAPYQTIEGSFRELEHWFSIAARAPEGTRLSTLEFGPVKAMMQVLLTERFGLKVRWESRPQTLLVLRQISPGKLGPKVKRLDVDCQTAAPTVPVIRGCRPQFKGGKGYMDVAVPRMADFADFLARIGERAVVDDTGLIGPFEFETTFDFASLNDRLTERIPSPTRPSLTNALRDDLGLKLDSEMRGVPVLIVEHVQSPTEN
jgi:uncharacterized protein (TIGR03435 family)